MTANWAGPAASAFGPKGMDLLSEWFKDRKCKKALARFFQEEFVEESTFWKNGKIKESMYDVELGGLHWSVAEKRWGGLFAGSFHKVKVVNRSLPADDPRHLRRFNYYPSSGNVSWIE